MFTFFIGGLGGRRRILLTIAADQSDYDIFVAAGSPTDPVEVVLTINTTIVLSSTSTSTHSLDTGTGWHANSTLKLINNGLIYGLGGVGGVGGYATSYLIVASGTAGAVGGPCIKLQYDLTIDNTNGNIFAGGGGGGAGGAHARFTALEGHFGGGGGGGGRSGLAVSGGAGGGVSSVEHSLGGTKHFLVGAAGSPGGVSAGGAGGAGGTFSIYWGGTGGAGGDWATTGTQAGNASTDCDGTGCGYANPGGLGGAPGKAIDLTGNVVTWLGGNDAARVKGVVS